MKTTNDLYSFDSRYDDLWHWKISDEPVDKKDCFSAEFFSEVIKEPFEVYEKHIRAIEMEKRIAYISVEAPTDEFPNPVIREETDMALPGVTFKVFGGEYDEEMKAQIKQYIREMGWEGLKTEEHVHNNRRKHYRFFPYSCDIYTIEHKLGFYLSRHGLLRNTFLPYLDDSLELDEHLLGDLKSFERIEAFLDKKYIQYMYGNEGLQRMMNYYRRNFIENFEYGKSILYLDEN